MNSPELMFQLESKSTAIGLPVVDPGKATIMPNSEVGVAVGEASDMEMGSEKSKVVNVEVG
jgi:hypothetical protein